MPAAVKSKEWRMKEKVNKYTYHSNQHPIYSAHPSRGANIHHKSFELGSSKAHLGPSGVCSVRVALSILKSQYIYKELTEALDENLNSRFGSSP